MMGMSLFWLNQQKQRTSCGKSCRSCRRKNAQNGVLDMETEIVSSLTSYGPGYIRDELKDLEAVVGLQTDKPLKRAFMPYGGIKMSEEGLYDLWI